VSPANLLFLALVAPPLVVAVCLGLSARSLVAGGRTGWLWLLVAVVVGVVWYIFVLGER
jgi:hypothetical protein